LQQIIKLTNTPDGQSKWSLTVVMNVLPAVCSFNVSPADIGIITATAKHDIHKCLHADILRLHASALRMQPWCKHHVVLGPAVS
jgi:hypothetical protein